MEGAWKTKPTEMKYQVRASSSYQVRNYERPDQAEQFKRGRENTGPQDMMTGWTGGGQVVKERNSYPQIRKFILD